MISCSILVIDDDPTVAEEIRRSCRALSPHIHVVEVDSGNEAAAMLTRMTPDLILLDVVLRHESAYEVLPDLRLAAPQVPIVVMSSDDTFAARYLCVQFGAVAFESKPSDPAGYAALIVRLEERVRSSSASFAAVVQAKIPGRQRLSSQRL